MRVEPESGWLQAACDPQHVFVYDQRGRLIKAFREGLVYDIALDNRALVKWQDPDGDRRRRRRLLTPAQAESIRQAARQAAAALGDRPETELRVVVKSRSAHVVEGAGSQWRRWLARAAAYTERQWAEDAARFAQVYEPVGILPPDQYASLVLQATLGCTYNRCTFCTFYRGRPFRVRRPEEFRRHVEQVQALLGPGLSRFHEIFLADANALAVPMPLLRPLFVLAAQALPQVSRPRISSFLDVLTGQHKSAADFHALVELGLDRVYLGLESGSQELLDFLDKPSPPAAAVQVVQAIKQAGAAVGVIFLVGAGGERYREVHQEETLALLQRLPLTGRDLVYLSPFVDEGGEEYHRRLTAAHSRPLTEPEIDEALHTLWRQARQLLGEGPGCPRVGLYDIREFIY